MGDPQAMLELLCPEFSFPFTSFLWQQQVAREPLWEARKEQKHPLPMEEKWEQVEDPVPTNGHIDAGGSSHGNQGNAGR